MKLYSCIATDTGTKKKVNQDAVMLKVAETPAGEPVALAVLCDGLGGLSHGEAASAAFVSAMEHWFTHTFARILTGEGMTEELSGNASRSDYRKDVRLSWEILTKEMNERIAAYGSANGFQLGTTAVCFLLIGTDFLLMNVGDSRLYKMTDTPEGIRQLTHDHSLVQRQIDRGQMSDDEARESGYKSVLLQCIGASPEVVPDFFYGNVTRDSNYILCTDGFWRQLTLDEMEEMFSPQVCNSDDEAETRVYRMIDEVKRRGEEDNISAILVCCSGFDTGH